MRGRRLAICALTALSCSAPTPAPAPTPGTPVAQRTDPELLLFRVESPDGQPISDALVTSFGGQSQRTDAAGRVQLPRAVASHGISVSTPGFALTWIRPPVEAQTVTLTPCPWVTLILADDVELPPPPVFLSVSLGVPGPRGSVASARTAGIDARGEVQDVYLDFGLGRRVDIAAPGPGVYEVVWGLTRRDPDGSFRAHSDFGFDDLRRLEIPPEGRSRFEVEPAAGALEELGLAVI